MKQRLRIPLKKMLLVWFLGSVLCGLIAAIITVIYQDVTYTGTLTNSNWRPIDDLSGVVILYPLGILFSILTPYSWVNLLALVVAIWLKDARILIISFLAALAYGNVFHTIFSAWMSV